MKFNYFVPAAAPSPGQQPWRNFPSEKSNIVNEVLCLDFIYLCKLGTTETSTIVEKNMVSNGLKWLKMHFKHHFFFFFFEMWKMPGSGPPVQFSFWWKSFMEIAIFWQKAASWRKIKEKRPHLKFNFTTRTSSIYLSRPFLKLGNGINLILVQHLHISTF